MQTQTSTYEPGQPIPGPKRTLALLLLINMFNYIDRQNLAAVEKPIRETFFGAGDLDPKFWMGLLPSAFLISYMITAPIFGWLADRSRRWLWIGVGVIVWSLASGASGLATSFGMLLLTRALVGIGEAAYYPAAPTILADLYPIERRGRVLAWFYMAIPVGSAIGYVLGGLMADSLGWRWAFFVVVPPGILLGMLCFFMPEPQRGRFEGKTVRTARWDDYVGLLGNRSYVFNTLGMTALTFALGGIAYWMPTYIFEYRMGTATLGGAGMTFGAITAVTGILATLAGGITGDILTRRSSGAYFWVSSLTTWMAVPLFLLVLITPFPGAWYLIFATEFCLFFNTGPTNTILANVTHPSVRASAFALNIFVIHVLGDVISPSIIGKITERTGGNMNLGFAAVAGAMFVSGLFWLLGSRHLGRDTAAVCGS